jgi:superfamily II DNA or RNA helicase
MQENISDVVDKKLLPYQIPHKMQMIEALNIRKRVLDASDTGTGKTYVAIALCKELGLEPFIICPKAVIPVWDDVCKFFNISYFGISNYEMLKNCRYFTTDYTPTRCPYMDKIIDGILDEEQPKKEKPKKVSKKAQKKSKDGSDSDKSRESESDNYISESDDEEVKPKKVVKKVTKKADPKEVMKNARLKKFGLKAIENLEDHLELDEDDKKTSESENSDLEGKEDKAKPKKSKKNVKFMFYLPANVMIIFDEAHRCKNSSSLTSKLLEGFNECQNKIMILSATITDKIKCFSPFGMFFGFYKSTKQFKMWIKKEIMFAKIKDKKFPTDETTQMLKVIHDKIFPQYGSRMKVKELIEAKMFPETQIQANCYYLENHIEIDKLYHEINVAVLDYTVKEMMAENLAKLIYCRQRMEMLKMPIFFDLIEDGLSNQYSIVVFVNYVESLNYICYHMRDTLKTKYDSEISVIQGGQTIEDRKENLENFQANKTRLIVIMSQAGGTGTSVHDIHKTHPRMSIISPTWSGDQTKQILGRVHRAGGTHSIQKLVYIAKTYEEDICKLIKTKLSVIDAINDGDMIGTKISKKALELENSEKVDEDKKIQQYIKGAKIDSIGMEDNSAIEDRLTKITKKKVKKSTKDTKETL